MDDVLLNRAESERPEANERSIELRDAWKIFSMYTRDRISVTPPVYELVDGSLWKVLIYQLMQMLFMTTMVLRVDTGVTATCFCKKEKREPLDAMLDFDLSSFSPHARARSQRTGTVPFMAREILKRSDRKEVICALHHDLESLFYVAIWQGVGYRGSKAPQKGDILADWKKDYWSDAMNTKTLLITGRPTAPHSMEAVLKYMEDKRLRIHCQGIGYCFRDANAEVTAQRVLEDEKWLKLSFEERLLATTQETAITVPAVTYAKWMKGAGEDPSCTCCPQKEDKL
ncbi:hypothetical protein DFH11DRAFT_1745828 [Phellopilus nigrolimitatus]|nr:hypothetical protein DFH11DRAFT_1745828 [Phellopilus nigrolimitatus]